MIVEVVSINEIGVAFGVEIFQRLVQGVIVGAEIPDFCEADLIEVDEKRLEIIL